jgi:hypothetical protein
MATTETTTITAPAHCRVSSRSPMSRAAATPNTGISGRNDPAADADIWRRPVRYSQNATP